MREIELKILLDADQERHLRAAPALAEMAVGRAVTQTLTSIYYDTPDQALRAAGIALRLRRKGRIWLQTAKKTTIPIAGGLSQPIESEIRVRGQNLALDRIEDDDLREEIIGLARPGLQPTVQTRFRRTSRILQAPNGARAELAIDKGEVAAASTSADLMEAELELIDGHPGDLFAMAARLFTRGPVRFSNLSKSARTALLAEQGHAIEPLERRKARPVTLARGQTAESAAITVLTECLDQVVTNLPVTILTDDPGGPHQLRVGLRRFRSALSAFRPALGRAALAAIADAARHIGAEAGRLRDLDVLIGEMIKPAARRHPEEPGFAALIRLLDTRRAQVRDEARAVLSGPETTRFGFDAGGLLAGRGWLDPGDLDQTARLAEPVETLARRRLKACWKALAAYGDRIEALTIGERHEMRKEIKKLRYVVEIFRSLFDAGRVEVFRAALRKLQDDFGALNDLAMAEIYLLAADAPGASDPGVQRATGRLIGAAEADADRLWPTTITDWHALAKTRPFWR